MSRAAGWPLLAWQAWQAWPGRALALVARVLLLGGLVSAGAPLQAAPAVSAAPAQVAPPDCAHAAQVDWQALAPGVWVWLPGPLAELSPASQGRILPVSAVVDGGQALVVDPGASYRQGWQVRQSLACQLGAQVRWVVNTHAHADSVLGNAAFADLQAQGRLDIVASAGTGQAMAQRCPHCLASLTGLLGEVVMQGSAITLPNRIVREGDVLQVGRIRLQVLLAQNAHTESDLQLWAPQQRVLWAGGLLYQGRIPELAQGSLNGWLSALPRLAALRPAVVVGAALSVAPAPLALPPIFSATEGYLQALRQRVLQALDAGLDGSSLAPLQLPGYAGWVGYQQRHGFNAQRAWRELEPQWMEGAALPGAPASASVPDIGR